jgi:hypothetical protein
MGGTIRKLMDKPEVKEKFAEVKAEAQPKSVASAADEALAARRRARRGGRALLSEERLTPESGVGQSTLGAGPMA